MHTISKKDLNSAELKTLTRWRSPTTVFTANGEVQTHEEATVYVKELDIFLTMKVLEDAPAVLSLGKLCDENGYSYEWINGQKPHLFLKTVCEYCVIRKTSFRSWFQACHRVLPQACLPQHPWHLQLCQANVWIDENGDTRTGWITFPQSCQMNVWKGKNGETRTLLKCYKSRSLNQPKTQNQIKMRITSENGETLVIPTYRNGCKNSRRILWMTEFLNTETHTRDLLMDYL